MTASRVQFKRGTTSDHASFTGAQAEITIDTDKNTAVVHDGSTAGGFGLLRGDVDNLDSTAVVPGSQIDTIDGGSYIYVGIGLGASVDTSTPVYEIIHDPAASRNLLLSFNNSGGAVFETATVNNDESISVSSSSTTVTQTFSQSNGRNNESRLKGIYDPDTEQSIIAFYTSSGIDIRVVSINSSGTITVGNAVTVSNTSGYEIFDMIYDTDRDEVILFTYKSADEIQAHIGTVSTNSISFGTAISVYSFPQVEVQFYDGAAAWDSTNNQFLLFYTATGGSGNYSYRKAVRGTSSGTSISLGTWSSTAYLPGLSSSTHYGYRGNRLICVGSNKFALVTVITIAYAGEGITSTIITTSGTSAPTINTVSSISNYSGAPINDTLPEVAFDGSRLLVAYAGGGANITQEAALVVRGAIGSSSITWSDITPLVSTGSSHSEESYEYEGAIAYDSTANRFIVKSERTTSGYHSAAINTILAAQISY